MTTQVDAVAWLNQQPGQHLDYDHQYGQQCVDFFNFYYQYVTGDGPYIDGYGVPGAKDLWNIDNNRFAKIPDSSTLVPQPGDVAVYGAAWGSGNGHVEVVVSHDDNGCTFIGENEHNDPTQGVVMVYRTWIQMRGLIGVMRFSWTVPAAQSQYTTTPITPKQVKVKPGMHEWNLALADFETVCNNPFTTAGNNQIITVAATLVRPDFSQFSYYLENASSPIGWNTLDCDDYFPPAPPVIVSPYIPPAAPVNVPIATIPIQLVINVPAYQSATDAMNRTNKWQTLDYGNYLVYQTALNGMKQIAKVVNGTKYWINPADNMKVPPLVVQTSANVQASFKWFFPTHEPVEYKVLQTVLVKDLLHGSPNIQITAGHNIDIYGSFEMGGRTYLRPLTSLNDKGIYSFYGIQTSDIYSGAPYLENEFDLGDEITSKWESFYDKAIKTIEGIFRLKRGK